jgi:hypothetical protein
MEHAVHLGAGHFIKVVSPTSAHALVKKIRKAFRDAQLDDDNIDFDALEADLGGDDNNEQEEDDTNNADDEADDEAAADFTVGDTIGKLSHLSNRSVHPNISKQLWADIGLQICSSPQATAFFNQCCRQAGVQELKLMQWIRTRWALMHNFLKRMLVLQKVGSFVILYLNIR